MSNFAASGVRILLRDGDYATPPEQIATDGDSGVLWYPNIGAGVSKSWIGGSPQLVTTTGRMPNFTGKEYAEHINANSAVDRTLPEILNPGQRIAISSRGNAIHRVLTGGGGRTISGNTLLTFANGANASARSGIVLVCRERSATGSAYSMEIESSYAIGGAGTPILS